ncbi:aconitate hydratase AcnA [Sinimarinibacterium sp. NLF-5-8]|uniref:aconitate hydratase AcnA n=1 Tax=Sinimarinibacterium sp. NLF-5-8 TaxID=2698684 RepID=UPI00137C1EA9|nr:aconitate hydratase AcnA [Sinimarinibacterium sp. NLF-5-8]QHS09438.1 aconitate hydratase AcnA [Sinimarinibacterium sp. NLF-5-8]
MSNSFNSQASLKVGNKTYTYYSLKALEPRFNIARLPYSIKVLLESLLRHEDGQTTTKEDIAALAAADFKNLPKKDINFTPARVVLQDFTGVPCVVDLAAMRDAIQTLGGDARKVNPLCPVELVIDHSVMIDYYGNIDALSMNAQMEFKRNKERYTFLRWGQEALKNFKVVPPDTGIIHQVNIEHLARVVFENDDGTLYPDSCFGTDSHTTMVNGIGVLGWGVGGIEAEAAMLGEPSSMLIPEVIGVRITGKLAEGATATDLVLTVTEMLRKRGVVEKFVEYFGPGLVNLSASDRCTLGNMSPEYGATCGIFPIDNETLNYLRLTGRSEQHIAVVKAYAQAQGMWWTADAPEAEYTDVLHVDLSTIEPSMAGPKRPQDRVLLGDVKANWEQAFANEQKLRPSTAPVEVTHKGQTFAFKDGAVVIAAITSCTNTSNPNVLVAAGLVARKARALGLKTQPWVKTSLAPGSQAVTGYLKSAGLLEDLEHQGFFVSAYGCTTCIGNSGPLDAPIAEAINANTMSVSAVLSGNRNFEGRVHQQVRMNYLASPPLVVAYALAGSTDIDLTTQPLGKGTAGQDVFLKDVWPSNHEIQQIVAQHVTQELFKNSYADVLKGDERWRSIEVTASETYHWDANSTYIQNPPYFDGMTMTPPGIPSITGARALAVLGDSVTTDHISPAGEIKADGPAGLYLQNHGVEKIAFNSFGSRRGNHEVMMRGTFANTRIKNAMTPGVEGGVSRYIGKDGSAGGVESIYDVAMKHIADGTPLVVLAGKEYGTGSSRDWAAKGTILLGVRAVISESFERIHRSNLVGMGVLPLNFADGASAASLQLDGTEIFDIQDLARGATQVTVIAKRPNGESVTFKADVRINTHKEWDYFEHGGVLNYMLRQMATAKS